MKELTPLEYLSAYLPYGLKCRTSKHQFKYGETTDLLVNGIAIDTDGECIIEFLHNDELQFSNQMNPVKPLLHPLSRLTDHMANWCVNMGYTEDLSAGELCFKHIITFDYSQLTYEAAQEVLKQHGDLFNLIESGKAIAK